MGNNFYTFFKIHYPINIVKQQLNEFWSILQYKKIELNLC